MDLIRKSDPNPIDTFVVACSFATEPKGAAQGRSQALRILARAGFSEAFSELAFERGARDIPNNWASRADWIFVEPTGLALNPQADVDSTNHQPLTCDLELEATKVAAGRLARVEAHTSGPFRGLERPRFFPVWAGVLAFAGVSFFGLAWIVSKAWIRRSGKSIRLIPARGQPALVTPSSYTVIVAPTSITGSAPDPAALPPVAPTVHVDTPGPGPTHSGTWERRALAAEDRAKRAEVVIRQGLFPHLSRWMREKFLQKLLVDRSQLLAAQEEATRKVRAVDARLTKLELQIQEQTRVYVRRIEELTAELQAAKQENRELIRAKITQIKIEMEAARKKLLDAQNKPGGKA